jgi:hypothetical protein
LVSLGNNRTEPAPDKGGFTRLTEQQFAEFWDTFEAIHQTSDNPASNGEHKLYPGGPPANTGFSATLLRNKRTEEYTFAIRSTESKPRSLGGDGERDGLGADFDIAFDGFAWAQIDAMEKYYVWLRDQSSLLPPGSVLNVSGYSLGGQP